MRAVFDLPVPDLVNEWWGMLAAGDIRLVTESGKLQVEPVEDARECNAVAEQNWPLVEVWRRQPRQR